jgi:hypothetical protein
VRREARTAARVGRFQVTLCYLEGEALRIAGTRRLTPPCKGRLRTRPGRSRERRSGRGRGRAACAEADFRRGRSPGLERLAGGVSRRAFRRRVRESYRRVRGRRRRGRHVPSRGHEGSRRVRGRERCRRPRLRSGRNDRPSSRGRSRHRRGRPGPRCGHLAGALTLASEHVGERAVRGERREQAGERIAGQRRDAKLPGREPLERRRAALERAECPTKRAGGIGPPPVQTGAVHVPSPRPSISR